MELSVIVTMFNEVENVKPLLDQIKVALTAYDHEIIIVDDGSTDGTGAQVKTYGGHNVKLLTLNVNYGQTAAMAAGIHHAEGEYIATIDGDLQNDPLDIPFMLEKLIHEHWDVVAGNRRNRMDGTMLRKIPSKIANRLIRNMTGVSVRDYGCTLKVMRKEFAKSLGLYGELHRFIPILAVMEGGKIADVDVRHHSRIYGKSKYGLGRTFKVLSDLILMIFFKKYFKRPIHFFGPLGVVCLLIGSAISIYLLSLKIMGYDILGRPLLILGVTLVLAGIQFLTFGIIAELVMRVYFESQNKKTYIIREIYQKQSPWNAKMFFDV